jgi:hypothetical protein
MDGFHFDMLTRSLTTAGSRRRALTGLFIGTLALVGARAEETAARNCKKIKNKRKRKKCRAKGKRCAPRCAGKECGDDGCGGVCGVACTGDAVCQEGSCFPRSTCSADITSYCTPPFGASCGAGATCFCARSAEGNVLCLLDEDEACLGSASLCETSAACPPGEACVDFSGCCVGDPAGSKRCLARCPAPMS